MLSESLYRFAVKWHSIFSDKYISRIEILSMNIEQEFINFGFITTDSDDFFRFYGDESENSAGLYNVIKQVTDRNILGSAIYSQWLKYISLPIDTLKDQEARKWFEIAFNRLAQLTSPSEEICPLNIKELRLTSESLSFNRVPDVDEEIMQSLIVSENSCELRGYVLNENSQKTFQLKRHVKYDLDEKSVTNIFNGISEFINYNHDDEFIQSDMGFWKVNLIQDDGIVYEFKGQLTESTLVSGKNISNILRANTEIPNLLAFDGKNKKIIKVTLNYYRDAELSMNVVKNISNSYINYGEELSIDGKNETVEYIRTVGNQCKISTKYESKGEISDILDTLNPDTIFTRFPETSLKDDDDKIVKNATYKITVEDDNGDSRSIKGMFDVEGLPVDFDEFAESIRNFINSYGLGEALNRDLSLRRRHHKDDLIYCKVQFDGYGREYYYLGDETIQVGDEVIVPVGDMDNERVATVIEINYYPESDVPYPKEKTKEIIEKY